MKQFYLKLEYVIAALALLAVTSNVNTTCAGVYHQKKIPEKAKKLRKF